MPVWAAGTHFLQAAEGQRAFACLDWYSGFFFSWEVILLAKSEISLYQR
jgi:hypothetical protein